MVFRWSNDAMVSMDRSGLSCPVQIIKNVIHRNLLQFNFTFQIIDCEGPLKPDVVESTAQNSAVYPASSVLILGEEDTWDNDKYNFWLAEIGKTAGQGFTLKLDNCARMIAGCQIKNKGRGKYAPLGATKQFKVLGSMDVKGPWKILVEDELIDTTGNKPASLLNFTFEQPVEIQFIMFELVSYWGAGGGLQYFAPIPTASKHKFLLDQTGIMTLNQRWTCN